MATKDTLSDAFLFVKPNLQRRFDKHAPGVYSPHMETTTPPAINFYEAHEPEAEIGRFNALCREALAEVVLLIMEQRDCDELTARRLAALWAGYGENHFRALHAGRGGWSKESACALAAIQSRDFEEMLAAAAGRLK